jgi:protoporphyrinogen oxidase
LTVVVLGAGIAGIGAGLALAETGRDFHLREAEDDPGGLVRTDESAGFLFDHTGHFLHFKGEMLQDLVRRTTVPLDRHERQSAVLVERTLVPYPIQYNLWALASSRLADAAVDELRHPVEPAEPTDSLADLLLSSWGPTLYELFFRPYNEKLWGRRLEDLPADCVGNYLPTTDVELAAQGALAPTTYGGYNGTFFYPASGRLGDVVDALAEPLAGQASYGCAARAVDLEARLVETDEGETLSYESLISTLPLDDLLALAGESPAPELFEATEILNVRVGFRGEMRVPHQWIYVPDSSLPFYRIGFPGNVNPLTCPPGCASISVEYTHPSKGPSLSENTLANRALDYVQDLGLAEVLETVTVSERRLAPAYVVNRSPGRPEFERIQERLAEAGVVLAGRFGTWDYLSIEESFESGWWAGKAVREAARV